MRESTLSRQILLSGITSNKLAEQRAPVTSQESCCTTETLYRNPVGLEVQTVMRVLEIEPGPLERSWALYRSAMSSAQVCLFMFSVYESFSCVYVHCVCLMPLEANSVWESQAV